MAVVIDKGDTLETVIGKLNAEIETRRTYGIRKETVPTTRKLWELSWSNGMASWYAGPPQEEIRCIDSQEVKDLVSEFHAARETCEYGEETLRKRGETLERLRALENEGKTACHWVKSLTQCLDANQISVVGLTRDQLDSIAPLLNQLPLYRGSFEAKVREEFSLSGIEIPPGISRIPLDELDPQTIKALVAKAVTET